MSIIEAQKLTIGYKQGKRGDKIVCRDLSFDLVEGELTCLLGPNGAGKSTLLRTVSGSLVPLSGNLMLCGRPLHVYAEKELSKMFALVLTDKTMAGGLTVFDLVALGRYPHTGFFGKLNEEDHAVIRKAMESVGILHKADSYVAELSDGVRQKVMIAKALAQECPVLILDEPTAFLDVVSRIEIMNLLHDLASNQQKTILLTTHDLEQALLMGDRLWLLSDNNEFRSGTTEELVFSGEIDRFFSRDEVVFDKMGGNFRISSSGKKIFIEAAGGELLFWTKNAIIRNGFCVADTLEQADIYVEIKTPDDILLKVSSGDIKIGSFEEFNRQLKNL